MTTKTANGMDAEQLAGLSAVVVSDAQAGELVVRTKSSWDDGFAVAGRTDRIAQGGVDEPVRHTLRTDWPEPFGEDTGPASAEVLLTVLGNCVATTYVLLATERGVAVDELEVTVEGRLNIGGLLGATRFAGLESVVIDIRVHSPAGAGVLQELADATRSRSPVLVTLTSPVAASVSVSRVS